MRTKAILLLMTFFILATVNAYADPNINLNLFGLKDSKLFLVQANRTDLPQPMEACMELRELATGKYFEKIGEVNVAQFPNKCTAGAFFIMSKEAMNNHNNRYDALVDYVNCLERNSK